MGRMRISTARIKTDAEKISQLNESIPTLVRELESGMEELSACWEGPAWGAYQKTVAEYMEILTEIYKNMALYSSHIAQAGEEYYRAEQDVCAKIDSVIVL